MSAAGPRIAATTAGRTKIPDPTMVLTMFAASARTPSARSSFGESMGAVGSSADGEVTRYGAADPTTTISTRLFALRPAMVAFDAIG